MQNPRFSVVIPTYERPDQLDECLTQLSPERQTIDSSSFEIIVSDDSESDKCRLVAQRHSNVRWTQGPRRGPAANRNHGASLAKSEWLIFTDDDCVPAAGWIAAFAKHAKKGNLVCEGKTTCELGVHSPREHAPENLRGGRLWSCNIMIERACFCALGCFDENFTYAHLEDIDLRWRILAEGIEWTFVQDAVVDHPPRQRGFGWQLAKLRESDIYFRLKHGKPTSLLSLYAEIYRGRIRPIFKKSLSVDSFIAAWSVVVETFYVTILKRKWQRLGCQKLSSQHSRKSGDTSGDE